MIKWRQQKNKQKIRFKKEDICEKICINFAFLGDLIKWEKRMALRYQEVKLEIKKVDLEQQRGEQDTFQKFFEQEVSGGQEHD